ncbi:hypothetical protein N1030_01740 [Desulfovibrio mangrovi]|uniref:phage head spike fiber domain-containing protein n=1 Tax=Desulfovibrio mangrovi TaxID=2976983 RepID=UPI002245004D|nr:hypothetical protein [Desulfovibrio mangrovi]UZP67717.1 hypothetical protein N1030_01740 [Desulfovibrio mangrovi]
MRRAYTPTHRPVVVPPIAVPHGIVCDFDFAHSLQDLCSPAAWRAALPSLGGKTYDRFGVLCRAGADVARLTGDGVLLEGQDTRLNPYATTFTTWIGSTDRVTPNDTIAPDGTKTASRIVMPAGYTNLRYQVSVKPSTSYVYTLWVMKNNGGAAPYLSIHNATAGIDIIPATGVYTAGIPSSGWNRVKIPFTTPANCTSVYIYAERDTPFNTDYYAWSAQLKEGAYETSDILGEGAPVTRASEHATADGSNGITLPLERLHPTAAAIWRGEREGTIAALVHMGAAHSGLETPIVGSATTKWRMFRSTSSGNFLYQMDGAAASVPRVPFMAGETLLLGCSREQDGTARAFVSDPSGSVVMGSGVLAGTYPSLTLAALCTDYVANPMKFSRLRVYDRELSQAELQSLHNNWMQGVL